MTTQRNGNTPAPIVLRGTQLVSKFNATELDEVQILLALFRVETKKLTEASKVFRDMLKIPTGIYPVEGRADTLPIHIPGITPEQFRNFLTFVSGDIL